MRLLIFIFFTLCSVCYGQGESKISTIEFVEILDDNRAETLFYYQNNWKVLRERALQRGYIHSFQLLEVPYSEAAPFHLMLMTTYLGNEKYEARETRFAKLIEEGRGVKLMNEKKPVSFRKSVFSKNPVQHLN